MSRQDISKSINQFHTFLKGKGDKNNPIYYLPEDVLETILKEHMQNITSFFSNPTIVRENAKEKTYIWKNSSGKQHRAHDLPAEITVSKKTDVITHMYWYTNGIQMRSGDQPCTVRYSEDGLLMFKQWNDGTNKVRRGNLPITITRGTRFPHVITCFLPNGEQEEYYSDRELPAKYGW